MDSARELHQIVHSRFGIQLVPTTSSQKADLRSNDDDNDECAVMEIDMANGSAIDISTLSTQTIKQDKAGVNMPYFDRDDDDDEEDDDGPVVVAEADVEASLERSAATAQASAPVGHSTSVEEERANRAKFPLILLQCHPRKIY